MGAPIGGPPVWEDLFFSCVCKETVTQGTGGPRALWALQSLLLGAPFPTADQGRQQGPLFRDKGQQPRAPPTERKGPPRGPPKWQKGPTSKQSLKVSPRFLQAHFAAAGCPLVNDAAYSSSSSSSSITSNRNSSTSNNNNPTPEDPYGYQPGRLQQQQEDPAIREEFLGAPRGLEAMPSLFSVSTPAAECPQRQQQRQQQEGEASVAAAAAIASFQAPPITSNSNSNSNSNSSGSSSRRAPCVSLGLQLCTLRFPDPLGPPSGRIFTVSVEEPPDWIGEE